jgi:hypothetical protein
VVEGESVGSDASEQAHSSNVTSQPFEAAIGSIFEGGRRRNLSSESAHPVGHLESLYNPQLLLEAIDLFFQHFYPDLLFSLHEPSVRLAAQSRKLNPILAVAILALTVRFMPDLVERHGSVQEACDYFGNAIRAELLLEADKPSLDKIHALLFLSLHEWGSGRGARAVSSSSTALNMNLIHCQWIYIGACIRSALLLRTFRKQTPLAPPFNKPLETPEELIVEESRIRVFWSMILMEQFMANGKHSSTTTYDEHNSIGKPFFEENFLWGTVPHSLTEPSWSRESAQLPCGPHSSEKAFLVAAVKNWNIVNRWVSSRGAKQEGEAPWLEGSRFDQLRNELNLWEANLPMKLRYNQNTFAIHNVNKVAGLYGFLHLVHYVSVIFLHREYLEFFPDKRKPYAGRLPSHVDFLAATSPQSTGASTTAPSRDVFWAASLHELFTAAYRITEILNELESLGSFMNTPFVGFAAFTASTMNIYLSIFPWVCLELAPRAQQRAESDVRYLKRVLAVWPLAQQWYSTTLRLYDSYKLLHISERTSQTPHVVDTFHSFDQSLFDYGEIKPGPEQMIAIRKAATVNRSENSATSERAADAQFLAANNEAHLFMSDDIDSSLGIDQEQYWNHMTEEFTGLMASFE